MEQAFLLKISRIAAAARRDVIAGQRESLLRGRYLQVLLQAVSVAVARGVARRVLTHVDAALARHLGGRPPDPADEMFLPGSC